MRQRGQDFIGKKVLITGGTKGLGLCCAKMFSAFGATEIFVSYRSDHEAAGRAREEIERLGAKCTAISCDLTEEGSVDLLFDELQKHTSTIDIYIHNAAATAFKSLLELKAHHIDKTFNLTVKAFILGVQRAVAMMQGSGAIVAISGMDTLKAVPRHGLLGAAKSALETLVAYYAHELAQRSIRVNSVNPGFLETDSTKKYLGAAFDQARHAFSEAVPLKRAPRLEEVGEAVLFLCEERSSWIIGQTLIVDGGLDFSLPVRSN
ncbi:MAG: SDR family oxidoreductase [Bdellovibrionota bacterium]